MGRGPLHLGLALQIVFAVQSYSSTCQVWKVVNNVQRGGLSLVCKRLKDCWSHPEAASKFIWKSISKITSVKLPIPIRLSEAMAHWKWIWLFYNFLFSCSFNSTFTLGHLKFRTPKFLKWRRRTDNKQITTDGKVEGNCLSREAGIRKTGTRPGEGCVSKRNANRTPPPFPHSRRKNASISLPKNLCRRHGSNEIEKRMRLLSVVDPWPPGGGQITPSFVYSEHMSEEN